MWTARLEDIIPHWDVVLLRDGIEMVRISLDDWYDLVAFIGSDAVNPPTHQPPPHPQQAATPEAGPRPG